VTVWTPSPIILVKVLGLAWQGERMLLGEVEDSSGRVKGVRPLGGAVEFGETREQTLAREFREELGCGVSIAGPWHAFENIFEHEGHIGHEYMFAANVLLDDAALYARERIAFLEADGTGCSAVWLDPRNLPPGVVLYPSGLAALLRSGMISAP
jgi:ADP-ribose pyrophosphatase YjhB (NUDIX family)